MFEGILTPGGISAHAKEYAGTFEVILTPEGILTHTKEYEGILPLFSKKIYK